MTVEIKGTVYWQDSDAARAAFHPSFNIGDDGEYLPDDGACPGTDFDRTDSGQGMTILARMLSIRYFAY